MSDPFDSLRTSYPMNTPPSAAEIRRRGDARSRRTIAVSIGAAAAVAAVAVPVGLSLGGSPVAVPPAIDPATSTPTPSESQTAQLITTRFIFEVARGPFQN